MKLNFYSGILIRCLILLVAVVCANNSLAQTSFQRAELLQTSTQNNYLSSNGTYYVQTNGGVSNGWHYWWNSNGLATLVDGYVRTRSVTYGNRMLNLVNGIKTNNIYGNTHYYNDYYDDMEWLALACIQAYKVTGNSTYMNVLNQIWPDIKGGYINGAISWNKSCYPGCKNSIANTPAIIIAARMHKLNGNAADLQLAKDLHAWAKANIINSEGGVWDSPSNFNEGWVFSYNVGMWIGACLELYKITKQQSYIDDATKTINYVLNKRMSKGGAFYLNETGGGDGGLFPGIFARYFAEFIRESNIPVETRVYYMDLFKYTADYVWEHAVNKSNYIANKNWSQMAGATSDYSVQLKAVKLFEAAASLECVYAYKDIDYNGNFYQLRVGDYNLAALQARGLQNNDITSMTVPPGYTVTLYDGDNFTGESTTITSNSTWMGAWNDRVTSLRITKGIPFGPATFYSDCNYSGKAINLPDDGGFTKAELESYGISENNISSIKILPGYIMRVYKEDNFQGASLEVSADNSCLVDEGFNDEISSIYIRPNGITGKSGTFFIRNRNSGKYLDLDAGSQNDGAKIIQWTRNGSANQQFKLTETSNGAYKISCVNSGKPWEIYGHSVSAGAKLNQWTDRNTKAQEFILIRNQEGYYQFVARHSGKVIEVKDASTANPADIQQGPNANQVHSQFILEPLTSEGMATFYQNCNFVGYGISLPEGEYSTIDMIDNGIGGDEISSLRLIPGYWVTLYQDNNEQGSSYTVSANDNCFDNNGFSDNVSSVKVYAKGKSGMNGKYFLKNRTSGLYMDITGSSNGSNVIQSNGSMTTSQSFTFTELSNGVYKITATINGKSLDIQNGLKTDQANLQLLDYSGVTSQQFILLERPEGYYQLVARHSGKVLEVADASITTGANIQQLNNTRQQNSEWELIVHNELPIVTITSPANNTEFDAPANIIINATASDSDGNITQVEFFNGSESLGIDNTNPYSFNWNDVAEGTYTITAVATDNSGETKTSAAIIITVIHVNVKPTVSITSPANNAEFDAPANITINATASDSDGNITQVEFFNGSESLGIDNTSPYSFNWNDVAEGTYTITAVASDNSGETKTSAAIIITVIHVNVKPTVSITSPTNNTEFDATASFEIVASATDADGNITIVEFYNGNEYLGSATSSPYSISWNNVAAGTYTITALARDNEDETTVSEAIVVIVNDVTTGINDESENSVNLLIVPNPVSEQLEFQSTISLEGGMIKIINSLGEEVLTLKAGLSPIDVSTLPYGMYKLIYIKNEIQIVREFIK